MSKKLFFVLAVVLAFFAPLALAHEEDVEEHVAAERLNPGAQVQQPMLYAFVLVLAIAIASTLLGKRLGEGGKKMAFWAIAAISVAATLYLIGSIAALFGGSTSGGPVHWHADFEVWACSERIYLKKDGGWSTRVGPILLHHHGDDRLHVEGVVRDKRDVSLGKFFEAIGGEFSSESLAVIDENAVLRSWKNGGSCPDGRAGRVKFFVNGVEDSEFGDYVISPHADVPPGDVLRIVFEP